MINLTIELNIYWVDFSHWSEQKLQTGLLKMHIHCLPVGGAFGMSEIKWFPRKRL